MPSKKGSRGFRDFALQPPKAKAKDERQRPTDQGGCEGWLHYIDKTKPGERNADRGEVDGSRSDPRPV